jgi:formate dehydrogenase subunit delta
MSHETKSYADNLVKMANQISQFFVTQKGQPPAVGTAGHIKKFWDPRMRKAIIAHVEGGGKGLEPIARQAIEELKKLQAA